jgi:hypothetical protein
MVIKFVSKCYFYFYVFKIYERASMQRYWDKTFNILYLSIFRILRERNFM